MADLEKIPSGVDEWILKTQKRESENIVGTILELHKGQRIQRFKEWSESQEFQGGERPPTVDFRSDKIFWKENHILYVVQLSEVFMSDYVVIMLVYDILSKTGKYDTTKLESVANIQKECIEYIKRVSKHIYDVWMTAGDTSAAKKNRLGGSAGDGGVGGEDGEDDDETDQGESEEQMAGEDLDGANPCAKKFAPSILINSSTGEKWKFDDLAGAVKEKSSLGRMFISPLTYPKLYMGDTKGILMYGPPGTGKTMLAKAASGALSCIQFFSVTGGDVKSKWLGGTEENIKDLYTCGKGFTVKCKKCIKNAERQSGATCDAGGGANNDTSCTTGCRGGKEHTLYWERDPLTGELIKSGQKSIIFFDEVDAVAGDRENDTSGNMTASVNMLLQMMDGIESSPDVVTLSATNYPWKLDSAIRRRFTEQVFVDLPDSRARKALIEMVLDGRFSEYSCDGWGWRDNWNAICDTNGYLGGNTPDDVIDNDDKNTWNSVNCFHDYNTLMNAMVMRTGPRFPSEKFIMDTKKNAWRIKSSAIKTIYENAIEKAKEAGKPPESVTRSFLEAGMQYIPFYREVFASATSPFGFSASDVEKAVQNAITQVSSRVLSNPVIVGGGGSKFSEQWMRTGRGNTIYVGGVTEFSNNDGAVRRNIFELVDCFVERETSAFMRNNGNDKSIRNEAFYGRSEKDWLGNTTLMVRNYPVINGVPYVSLEVVLGEVKRPGAILDDNGHTVLLGKKVSDEVSNAVAEDILENSTPKYIYMEDIGSGFVTKEDDNPQIDENTEPSPTEEGGGGGGYTSFKDGLWVKNISEGSVLKKEWCFKVYQVPLVRTAKNSDGACKDVVKVRRRFWRKVPDYRLGELVYDDTEDTYKPILGVLCRYPNWGGDGLRIGNLIKEEGNEIIWKNLQSGDSIWIGGKSVSLGSDDAYKHCGLSKKMPYMVDTEDAQSPYIPFVLLSGDQSKHNRLRVASNDLRPSDLVHALNDQKPAGADTYIYHIIWNDSSKHPGEVDVQKMTLKDYFGYGIKSSKIKTVGVGDDKKDAEIPDWRKERKGWVMPTKQSKQIMSNYHSDLNTEPKYLKKYGLVDNTGVIRSGNFENYRCKPQFRTVLDHYSLYDFGEDSNKAEISSKGLFSQEVNAKGKNLSADDQLSLCIDGTVLE